MAQQPQRRHNRGPRKVGVWDNFVALTIGNVFTFVMWCFAAIFISILIEWVGMALWWSPLHSREMLRAELSYLNGFGQNLVTGIYPGELAERFLRHTHNLMESLHIPQWGDSLRRSGNALGAVLGYGVESAVNTVFLFACRLAVCVSAATGFLLIALLAAIDGLTERDIRKACGGNESAMRYHHAKRFIFPSIALAFGFYLTVPFTVHPALVFLPIMLTTGLTIYVATSTFKKFL